MSEHRRRATFDPSILETPPSNGSEWKVIVALLLHHNWKERAAWPSVRKLAEMTGLDKGTVSRAIRSLEEAGLLRKGTRNGRLCYHLPTDHRNRILGGPDRWKYIDRAVVDSQRAVVDSQQTVVNPQQQGCQMTTPSETGADVTNVYKNNGLNIGENPAAGGYRPPQSYEEAIERNRQP
jgi:DNA-binding transcriptional MocR family regulator